MRATLPPEVVATVRLSTWSSLFAAHGAPAGLSTAAPSLEAVTAALGDADLPVPLARALVTIATLATDAARADVFSAAEALALPGSLPEATSPADLAAQLLAAAPADPAIAEVLAAAKILRDRTFRPRSTYVFLGRRGVDGDAFDRTELTAHLSAAVAAWGARRGFGAVHAVVARAEPGVLGWDVIHEGRAETVVSRAGVTTTRPLRSHHLEYQPGARRLSITTDLPEAVTPLATLAGRVLFASERHFLEERAVDLWRLQELGARALEVKALAPKLLSVSAIGGTWHSGKDHAVTPRGQDFFRALQRYKIRIEGGRLDAVTLRAKLPAADGGPAQCDVTIRPPHEVQISEPEVAPLVGELLDRAELRDPPPRARDFYALQPWIDSAAGWTETQGAEAFASLVARGLLVADPSNRAVPVPGRAHAGRAATAYPLSAGRFLAVSPDPTVAPFVVREEALTAYALSFARLAAGIAEEIGLDGPSSALDDDGVLLCGRRVLGPTHVVVSLLTRPIRAATVVRLREAAGHGHAILVVPEGRARSHGLREVPLPPLAGPFRPLLGAIVRSLKIEAFVDTCVYAPEGTRIVVHRATTRVWVDGVACTAATETHVRLLELLIERAGQLVHTKDLAEHVARGQQHSDTTRKAIDSFFAAVAKSFKAQGRTPPRDLRAMIAQPKLGMYRLKVPGFVE